MAMAGFMKELVDFSLLRYAVIEALKVDADPERFVIAYRTEQELHDVIAAPCIIARGFSSRKEAEASTKVCVSAAAA
jgi:hypothetical protein